VADRNSCTAGGVDGGLEIGEAHYVVDKLADASHPRVSCIVGRKAAANFKFRCKCREIILGSILVRIDKDKIKWPIEFLHHLMGIGKPGVDII